MFLSNQFYSQRSVFISHQRESEVFIKFSNHARKPYFLQFLLWAMANRCLELTLVKEVRPSTISLRRHFDKYPKLAFYSIVRAEVFVFVKTIEYLTNYAITLKTLSLFQHIMLLVTNKKYFLS